MNKQASLRQQNLEQHKSSDTLAEMLSYLRMSSVFYTRSELSAPWGIDMPPMPNTLMFHLLVMGQCQVEAGQQSYTLKPGEFILLPQGSGHRIHSACASTVTSLFELPLQAISEHYEVLQCGGGGDASLLLCGAVQFDDPLTQRVLSQMPALLPIAPKAASLIQQTLALLAEEAERNAPGCSGVITRMADVLIIQTIREWLQQQSQPQGWIAAWQDKKIGKALRMMHQYPERDWSVADLASEATMSRTSFSTIFKNLTQITPLLYLTEWRMSLAQEQLKHSRSSVLDIALSVGYQSESSFSRAFKKATGQSPKQVRQK